MKGDLIVPREADPHRRTIGGGLVYTLSGRDLYDGAPIDKLDEATDTWISGRYVGMWFEVSTGAGRAERRMIDDTTMRFRWTPTDGGNA